MLSKFHRMGWLEKEDRDRIVRGWGKRYALGSLVGADGVERETIDEAIFAQKTVPHWDLTYQTKRRVYIV